MLPPPHPTKLPIYAAAAPIFCVVYLFILESVGFASIFSLTMLPAAFAFVTTVVAALLATSETPVSSSFALTAVPAAAPPA